MRVEPYRRHPKLRRIGLVTGDRMVLHEDGRRSHLAYTSPELTLYADAHLVNRDYLRRGDGWCLEWNDRPVRWFPDDDHAVILLQGYPGDGDDVLAGLVAWRDHLHAYGAGIGSPASASYSLLRATIAGPAYFGDVFNPDRPKLSQVLGGRQEAFRDPGAFGEFAHLDLSAAYARTLGTLAYPLSGHWVRFDHRLPAERDMPTLVRAVLEIPAGIPGPVPSRPRRRTPPGFLRSLQEIDYPTGRRVQGIWTRAEVELAERHGAKVRVVTSWLLSGVPFYPFSRWWEVVQAGRKLPGFAGDLYKQTGNTLWGRFALDGVRARTRFEDGRRVSRTVGKRVNQAITAPDVAEAVTSTVRVRLYDELIEPFADRLVSVHTDGGLILGPFTLDDSRAMGRDWRAKHSGNLLVFLTPQTYAYRGRGDRGLTYVVSGLPKEVAASAFRELARPALGWPPTRNVHHVAKRERDRLAALV